MTDTPERIWACKPRRGFGCRMGTYRDTPDHDVRTEYTRADLHAAAITELVEGLRRLADKDFGSQGWDESCERAAQKARALIAKYGDKTND